jgi:anti-sigma factor RsiW
VVENRLTTTASQPAAATQWGMARHCGVLGVGGEPCQSALRGATASTLVDHDDTPAPAHCEAGSGLAGGYAPAYMRVAELGWLALVAPRRCDNC